MARRRILLAEVQPRVPGPIVYPTWNPLDKSADLTLSGGNLVASKSTTHATQWAGVRSTVGFEAGRVYWETPVTFTGASANACLGISGAGTPGLGFTVQLGTETEVPAVGAAVARDGNLRMRNGIYGNIGALANGDVVRHVLDLDAKTYAVARNGGTWLTIPIFLMDPIAFPLVVYPRIGLLRPVGTVAGASGNFGASPFAYAVPDNTLPGAYLIPEGSPVTLYFGSEAFNTDDKDVPANTRYLGRIAGDAQGDVTVDREAGCWAQGTRSSSRPGQLVLINRDGALDHLLDYDWRDAPIELFEGYAGDARGDFTSWTKGTVDRCEANKELRLVLPLVDQLALLDRPMQPDVYPDDAANTSIVGKPRGIVLGQPQYCEGALLDTTPSVRDVQIHDGTGVPGFTTGISSIAQVYDRGDLFHGPNDAYTPHNAITTATTGAAGGGAFTNWANDGAGVSMPFNWTRITAFGAANDRFVNNGNALRCQSSGQQLTAIFHTNAVQTPYRYTLAFNVSAVAIAGTLTFRLGGQADGTKDYAFTISTTGAKSLSIETTGAAQLQIVLGASELDVTIDNFTCSSVQVIDWTYWPNALLRKGVTLANRPAGKVVCNPVGPAESFGGTVVERLQLLLTYLHARAVLQNPNLPPINAASVAALIASDDFRLAAYVTEPKTFLSLIEDALAAWYGWVTCNRAGEYLFGRVGEPSQTPVLTLSTKNIKGEVSVKTDLAKGLSLRIAGRRNHSPHSDSDLVSSVTEALRSTLKAEFGCVRTGSPAPTAIPVSVAYVQAIAAPAKATMLQDDGDIQTCANRGATYWRQTRKFYELSALLTASAADALEPGQTVRLVWPRYGLSAGRNMLVMGVRSRFFSRLVDLKLLA